MKYIIFRPHNVYGEHQNIGDRYRNVIGIFMNQIMQGNPLTVFGNGEQARAFSYIDDVAPYISLSVQVPSAWNEVINIGADTPYSINRLIRVIAYAFHCEPQVEYLTARKEVMNAYASHSKARRLFEISKTINLEEGIQKWPIGHG